MVVLKDEGLFGNLHFDHFLRNVRSSCYECLKSLQFGYRIRYFGNCSNTTVLLNTEDTVEHLHLGIHIDIYFRRRIYLK